MNKKTYDRHFRQSQEFCRIRSVNELCRVLRVDRRKLLIASKQARYKSFSIPKKGGGERHIETPTPMLKNIQSKLNRYLQSVYYFEKSYAAYGFIIGIKNDDDRRNVLTNAKKHLKRPYLLNVDLKDFFHSVKKTHILAIFQGPPFRFQHDLPGILTKLTTHKGRLPMGAPTSPALSNLACRTLDDQLLAYSESQKWKYTRYADDLSLSSLTEISEGQILEVRKYIEASTFKVNEKKLKMYGTEDEKIVTGLLLKDKVELTKGYLEELTEDLLKFKYVMEVQNFQGELSSKWVEKHKTALRGRVNFAGFVLGKRDEEYLRLKDLYYEAINPPEEEFGAVSWWGFPYNM